MRLVVARSKTWNSASSQVGADVANVNASASTVLGKTLKIASDRRELEKDEKKKRNEEQCKRRQGQSMSRRVAGGAETESSISYLSKLIYRITISIVYFYLLLQCQSILYTPDTI